jgi:hypothetical protein
MHKEEVHRHGVMQSFAPSGDFSWMALYHRDARASAAPAGGLQTPRFVLRFAQVIMPSVVQGAPLQPRHCPCVFLGIWCPLLTFHDAAFGRLAVLALLPPVLVLFLVIRSHVHVTTLSIKLQQTPAITCGRKKMC